VRQRKVLIVDDDQNISRLLAQFLAIQGYEGAIANSAAKALALLSHLHFDAFLLDIDMPGKNGISLCREIRKIKEYEATPILFMTGAPHHLEEAFAAGCDDFITKPVDQIVIRARLKGHLERAEQAELLTATRRMLDQYVSKRTRDVAESAAKTGMLPQPHRQNVVVLFTDIRGFTSLSEELDPGQLFSQISANLAMQVDLIYDFGGYVDKFGGDGLMAVFDGSEMAAQSCLCALSIVREAQKIAVTDDRLRQLGIGIHMGPVVIGNIGSPEHLDYSAIGATVNLAARLCGQASALSIVVSEAVRNAVLGDSRLRLDSGNQVTIRGIKEPVSIYHLVSGEV